jgi:hypothetical protein
VSGVVIVLGVVVVIGVAVVVVSGVAVTLGVPGIPAAAAAFSFLASQKWEEMQTEGASLRQKTPSSSCSTMFSGLNVISLFTTVNDGFLY